MATCRAESSHPARQRTAPAAREKPTSDRSLPTDLGSIPLSLKVFLVRLLEYPMHHLRQGDGQAQSEMMAPC